MWIEVEMIDMIDIFVSGECILAGVQARERHFLEEKKLKVINLHGAAMVDTHARVCMWIEVKCWM